MQSLNSPPLFIPLPPNVNMLMTLLKKVEQNGGWKSGGLKWSLAVEQGMSWAWANNSTVRFVFIGATTAYPDKGKSLCRNVGSSPRHPLFDRRWWMTLNCLWYCVNILPCVAGHSLKLIKLGTNQAVFLEGAHLLFLSLPLSSVKNTEVCA